jgi:drug/metabolite transporter (DMT)-like permease
MSEPEAQHSSTLLLTTIAMLAFAANSLLCRLALGAGLIDAASFTGVRVASGAIMLGLIVIPRFRAHGHAKVDWRAVLMLFTYMICFSIAYLSLGAGTGALILFGAVQLTMFVVALRAGEEFSIMSWMGLSLAIGGLIYLVFPGVSAPDPVGALLMAVAGIAWGFYSLIGRSVSDPMEATAYNFVYSMPLVAITSLLFIDDFHITSTGAALAVASGAIASGLGYFVWYAALRGLSAIRAATVQLSVPIIAAFGGVLLLAEDVTLRLLLASAATLGGVAIVLSQKVARTP